MEHGSEERAENTREGAPAEHRRQLDRAQPDPDLARLKIHCATCGHVASTLQMLDGGQVISYWDGYRWYGMAAFCRTHGPLKLDPDATLRATYAAYEKVRQPARVSHLWAIPDRYTP